jgi:hypothetical protein
MLAKIYEEGIMIIMMLAAALMTSTVNPTQKTDNPPTETFRKGDRWAVIRERDKKQCILISGGGFVSGIIWSLDSSRVDFFAVGDLVLKSGVDVEKPFSIMFLNGDAVGKVWHDMPGRPVMIFEKTGYQISVFAEDFLKILTGATQYGVFNRRSGGDKLFFSIDLEKSQGQVRALTDCRSSFRP